jgi:AraC-like DNA-binding protein
MSVVQATSFMSKTTSANIWRRKQNAFLGKIAVDSHFHRLFEAIPGLHLFVKDRQGVTLFVSSDWTKRHGFEDPQEMLGKTDRDLTPGPLAEQYLADDAQIYRTGEPILNRVELCRDEVGLPDWHVTSKYPVKDRRGCIIGIMGVSRWCGGQPPSDSAGARLLPALELLRRRLHRFTAPTVLAKACHLSVRQLQRRFTIIFGISPQQYWMKLRLRAACESLRQGDEPITAIAQRLGFCDQSSFTAHFRRHTGHTPNRFRLGKF